MNEKLMLMIVLCYFGPLTNAQLKVESYDSGADRYWLIYDSAATVRPDNLIVFLHGFAASNPACYGGWIEDLAASGNFILFPKFQNGIFLPRTKTYEQKVDRAIKVARDTLARRGQAVAKITFVSHSIGGIIAANLANAYGKSGEPRVAGMALVQPGFRYAKLGLLESYANIDSTAAILLITGSQDRVAGDKFAARLYKHAPQVANRTWLKHFPYSRMGEYLNATHKDPISPLRSLDTGNKNFIIVGALMICRTNKVDRYAFWQPTKAMVESVNRVENFQYAEYPEMGTWSDGTLVENMLRIVRQSKPEDAN